MGDEFGVWQYNGGGTAWLVVQGVIDLECCPALLGTIVDAAGRSAVNDLVIDLRRVPILTAAGIRALLEGQAAAQWHDCGYRVVNACPIVERVLRITGLTEVFRVGAVDHAPRSGR
ncbi:STAS domain-containing protein [Actinoplanes sp. NPDC026623]|uniref:STAS domain-containing protein n=1 Tax=Actinoplanes sp. NPDC026623 TaxID=3155610 RepID=UPI0033F4FB7F